jgi:Ala-tRNA(Pro) deacylase
MSIPEKLARYLEERKISFQATTHPEAFTAQQSAQAAHVPGRSFAKSVMVNVDGKIWMAVVPATGRVDLSRMQQQLGAKKTRLASEAEFSPLFGDCDLGAMPRLPLRRAAQGVRAGGDRGGRALIFPMRATENQRTPPV